MTQRLSMAQVEATMLCSGMGMHQPAVRQWELGLEAGYRVFTVSQRSVEQFSIVNLQIS